MSVTKSSHLDDHNLDASAFDNYIYPRCIIVGSPQFWSVVVFSDMHVVWQARLLWLLQWYSAYSLISAHACIDKLQEITIDQSLQETKVAIFRWWQCVNM